MTTPQSTSNQTSDAVADALQQLAEIAIEVKDTLETIANEVQTLASSGSG